MPTILRTSLSVFFLFVLFSYAYSQPATTIECGYAQAGKLKIYHCRQGKGSPIIFLHAGFLDRNQWNKQAKALSGKYTVITIDLPGHGLSKGIDTSIRIAEVIKRVMNQMNIPAASFVGISLGATCAVDFAIAHPEMTNRLLLCSAGLNGWKDVLKLDTLSKQLFIRTDTYSDTRDPSLITKNFMYTWLDGPFRKTAPIDSATRNYVYNTVFAKVSRKSGSAPVFDRRTAAKRVRLIRKPVMILYGSLDIPFIIKVSMYLHQQIKGSQMHVIDNAAHLCNLEKPELFNQYIKSWIR